MALVDKIVSVLHMNNDWTDELGALNGTANGATFDGTIKKLGSYSGNFDGLDDYVNLGTDATIKALTKGAVVRWLYVASSETANTETYSFGYGGDASNNFVSFNVKTDGTSANFNILQRFRSDGTINLLTSDTAYATDTWHLVVMESTGTAYKLYVNNAEDTYTVNTGSNNGDWWDGISPGANDKFVVGAIYSGGGYAAYFKGNTDELLILDDVTDADDRTTLWNDGDGIEYPFSVPGGSIFSLFRRRRH